MPMNDTNFSLTADQQMMLDEADRFARNELYPLAQKMDDDEWWPDDAFPQIGENGYFGITVPEKYGGAGLDYFTSGLIVQAMSRWNYALALSWIAHENLCLNNIFRNANEDQRMKFLPGLCDGTAVGALGLTEPGAGSFVVMEQLSDDEMHLRTGKTRKDAEAAKPETWGPCPPKIS